MMQHKCGKPNDESVKCPKGHEQFFFVQRLYEYWYFNDIDQEGDVKLWALDHDDGVLVDEEFEPFFYCQECKLNFKFEDGQFIEYQNG